MMDPRLKWECGEGWGSSGNSARWPSILCYISYIALGEDTKCYARTGLWRYPVLSIWHGLWVSSLFERPSWVWRKSRISQLNPYQLEICWSSRWFLESQFYISTEHSLGLGSQSNNLHRLPMIPLRLNWRPLDLPRTHDFLEAEYSSLLKPLKDVQSVMMAVTLSIFWLNEQHLDCDLNLSRQVLCGDVASGSGPPPKDNAGAGKWWSGLVWSRITIWVLVAN